MIPKHFVPSLSRNPLRTVKIRPRRTKATTAKAKAEQLLLLSRRLGAQMIQRREGIGVRTDAAAVEAHEAEQENQMREVPEASEEDSYSCGLN